MFEYLLTITNDFNQEVKYLRIFQNQINSYERTKEYMNANHKFDTRVVLTFLGNEKELILCYLNRERRELLAKKQDHFK